MKIKGFLILLLLAMFIIVGVASDIFAAPPHPKFIEDCKTKGKSDYLKARLEAMKKAGQDSPPKSNRFPTTGNHNVLVLRIQYSNLSFNSVSTNTFYDGIFENGPSGNGMSWKKYYQDMSNNTLNLSFDVKGPYTAANGYAYYGANTGAGGNDAYPATLVGEAIDAANNAGVDFSLYNDGTNHVSVIVIHSGRGEETGAGDNYIWSHEWTLDAGQYYGDGTGHRTYDGMTINNYSIQPEYLFTANPNDSTIGVFCHEFGHVLGLPDLYDYTNATDGVGNWSLMAGGANNGYNGDTPAPLLAWEKNELGWITIDNITPSKSAQSVNINTPSAPEVNIDLSENIKIDGNNSFLIISLGIVALLGIVITLLIGLKKGLKNNIMLLMFFVLVLIPLSAFVYSCVLFGWEAPNAPTGLTASDGTYSDKINVTWSSVSNATLYRLYYSTSQSGTYVEIGDGLEVTNINVTGITAGTTYWFKAKAENSYGISSFSNADSGYASSGGNPPSAPTGLTASDGTYSDKINVTWNTVSGATIYRLYYSTSQYGTYTEIGSGSTATSVNVTGITAGTTYWFKAKAGNSYGLSGFSNADSGYASSGSGGSVSLSDVETSHRAVKIVLGDSGKQYYLIENKVKTTGTWAEELPGAGLLICHIDEDFTIASHPNDGSVHGVNVKEADGNNELWTSGWPGGEAGDTYKSPKTLTPTSTPNSNLNSNTVQNGGGSSGISITNISAVGSTMTFDVSD